MNAAAFRRDLLEMQSELQRFAFKLTADKEEANDLMQETSLRALENMEKYAPDTNFKAWLYTIMRNLFINDYRKVLREQTFVDYTDNLYNIDSTQLTNDSVTENDYDRKELYRALNSLPNNYKVPFCMFVSGFKYREIADKLSLPLGTVKSRIFFTRRSLQEELKDFLL
ncbi:MAG: sigma-70 family RNA polymerase sigma factor [Bacteroidaceae bacterium]|nr:sigma-70 family RNA polymerase sigma factor [Bacteroidaceae bacterium]